ncbi:L-alanine-DL-glutamate epimerase [hydrothermal vent metagenome]|uniref:L-alanine-DL-glutamate epimerase n=1 Tax=hydrothermal vent metagenome TaxID=652676 RepID=A0A1W1BE27_9ZZZZ
MTITHIETRLLKAPLKRPFHTALRHVDLLEDLIVKIYTDSGDVGYGEGAPTALITGETIGTMRAVIEYISPLLVGRDIEEFEALIDIVQRSILKNTTAKSALEIALYDLKAKSLKLPLYRYLGGEQREFETDITISLGSVEEMVSDALDAISLGYNILKIKVGDDISIDIDRVVSIYEVAGDDITLRLDANQGWSREESVDILTTLEGRGIRVELIEQPTKVDDIGALKYIRERVETPILADESIFTLDDAKRLLDSQSIDFVNIKLAKCGGISNALKLADLANSYGAKCMLGCMLEGAISVGAGVHVASAKSDIITMFDLDAVNLCRSNPVDGGVRFDESRIYIPDGSGLDIKSVDIV